MKWLVVVLLLMIGCSEKEKPRDNVINLTITPHVLEQICKGSRAANKAIIGHNGIVTGRYDYNIDYKIYSCENETYIQNIKEEAVNGVILLLKKHKATLTKETWADLEGYNTLYGTLKWDNDEEE